MQNAKATARTYKLTRESALTASERLHTTGMIPLKLSMEACRQDLSRAIFRDYVSADAKFASRAGAHHADLMKDSLDLCHPGDCHPAHIISPQVSGAPMILKDSAQRKLTPDIRTMFLTLILRLCKES